MDTFRAYHADILDPAQQPRVIALLRDHGLVTFTGITDTGTADPGYAAFTDAELISHTDGTSLPDPPGVLLLTCQQPASHGGATLLADAAGITATLAGQHPAALRALSTPRAACFGTGGGYLGPVCEPAGPGRVRIRLRLDELAMFSADAIPILPILRTVISQHQQAIQLRTPRTGTGKPERPKHLGGEVWSRRITEKDRLVYDVQPDVITIIACRFHYDDH
jgi:Txe/YoeB family toxin of toxin-antitoxin system